MRYFFDHYTIDESVIGPEMDESGRLETYGKDLEIAKKVNPKKLWTIVEDEDTWFALNGFHLVNRLYYVVTNEECTDPEETFLFDNRTF